MYSAVLILHSWLRWAVLIVGLLAVVRAATGLSARKLWTPADNRGLVFFTVVLDVQTLLGLILYLGVSPIIGGAFQNLGAAMQNSVVRFFVVEHVVGMLIAVTLAHIGRARIRKGADAHAKHRTALLFVGLTMIVLLLSIPWPGMPAARPLFRLSGS